MSIFGIGGSLNVFDVPLLSQFSTALGLQAGWEQVDQIDEIEIDEERPLEGGQNLKRRPDFQELRNHLWKSGVIRFMRKPAAFAYALQKIMPVGTPISFLTAQGILRHWAIDGYDHSNNYLAQLRRLGYTEVQITDLLIGFINNTDFDYDDSFENRMKGLGEMVSGAKMFLKVILAFDGRQRLDALLSQTPTGQVEKRKAIAEVLIEP